MAGPGAELRRRRETLGLSLDQVSAATGLTREALSALEDGTEHRLTRGPYGETLTRTYRLFLQRVADGQTDAPATQPAPSTVPTISESTAGWDAPSRGDGARDARDPELAPAESAPWVRQSALPLPLVRAFAVVSILGLFTAIGLEIRRSLAPTSVALADPPALFVRVRMQRNAHMVVAVDGVVQQDRTFEGKEDVKFEGRERVEIDVPDIQVVKLWFNDRPVEPRGQIGRARKLVFIADGAGAR